MNKIAIVSFPLPLQMFELRFEIGRVCGPRVGHTDAKLTHAPTGDLSGGRFANDRSMSKNPLTAMSQ